MSFGRHITVILFLFSFSLLVFPNSQDFLIPGFYLKTAIYKHEIRNFNKILCSYQYFLPWHDSIFLVSTAEGQFQILSTVSKNKNFSDEWDVKITFRLMEGMARDISISGIVGNTEWSKNNYVFFPGALYNGNRFKSRRIEYSPKLLEPKDIGPFKEAIIADIPKLNLSEGPSSIHLKSGAMSLPCMGFLDFDYKKGMLIITEQENEVGDYLFSLKENNDRTIAEFSIGSPAVRENYKYRICSMTEPSDDLPATLKKGDSVSMNLQIILFPSSNVQEFLQKYFTVRHSLNLKYQVNYTVPLSVCFRSIENKFNKQNFVAEYGYYSVGMRENFLQDWQIGWTGGMISTLPLLIAGNKQSRENVLRNFEWLFPAGICPSGFFYDSGEKGRFWYGGDIRRPHTTNWHLVRKSGDGLYYILRQFAFMEEMGVHIKPQWDSLSRKVADAFVKLWNTWYQFGQFIDSNTGNIIVGGSTSGAIVPAALVEAYKRYHDKSYLQVACQAADSMVQNFLLRGYTCGGPGDALQSPDSESSYALLESLVSLYEVTGDSHWVAYAETAAWLFSSWVMAYDYRFPPHTTLGKRGVSTRGTVIANAQNTHAAPGICTYSGNALLRLYRITGRAEYLFLLQEIVRATPQYLSLPERPVPGLSDGWMSERINTTDWLEGIGEIMKGSTWAETSLMLQYVEIPGVYIHRKNSLIVAFDQVEVLIDKKNHIKIRNKTPYDCAITVFEDSDLSHPLPSFLSPKLKRIHLKPYEEKIWY